MEEKIWSPDMLGVTFNYVEGRITVFRSTLESIGWPRNYRFLFSVKNKKFAVQGCSADAIGSHRTPKLKSGDSCEIKCKALVRLIYCECRWDKTLSYRVAGVHYAEKKLADFDLRGAFLLQEGKVQESPTFSLCRAKGDSAGNNPNPRDKADSGAM